jgi:hypothetical protein
MLELLQRNENFGTFARLEMMRMRSVLNGSSARSRSPINVLDFFQVEKSHSSDEGSCGDVHALTSCSHVSHV